MKVRVTLWLRPTTVAALRQRSHAHGLSMSAYADATLLGHRPGGAPGQTASAADEWWDTLPPSRREQIHGWVANPRPADDEQHHPDQLTIFDGGNAHDGAEIG